MSSQRACAHTGSSRSRARSISRPRSGRKNLPPCRRSSRLFGEEAAAMIVNGLIDRVTKELPREYAV